MKKAVPVMIIILLLVIGGVYMWSQWSYSEGEQAGVLMKLSKRGFMFKTNEGELNVIPLGSAGTPMASTGSKTWIFSVKDAATADSLSANQGKYVNLHYKQIEHSWSWQGETNYLVDKVTVIK